MDIRRASIAAGAALLAFAPDGASADSPRVGVAGAVNPSAAGTPPGSASRQLVVGSDIVFRERVITTTDGQAQILFLDQSSLLIGPNSTVVIDEFVYDPATSKGNIAATLTQGSFRYIGGKLSKQGNATLKTPVATLGIRGSDVTVGYSATTGSMNVVTTHGSASLTMGTDVVSLRSGFGLTVSGNDKPGSPVALTAAQIAAANKSFEGQPGKTGGAGKPPTDGDVANSGLGSAVEAQSLAAIAPAAGGPPAGTSLVLPFTPGNTDTPPVPPAPKKAEPVTSAPIGSVGRTDRTLNGYVAGVGVSTPNINVGYGVGNAVPTEVTIRTIPDADGIGRVSADLVYRPVHHQGAFGEARVLLGDPAGAAPATQSTFTDDANFVATQAAGANAGQAQVDGSNVGVAAVLTSVAGTTPVGAVTGESGAGPACACQFVTWGVWSATVQVNPSVAHSVPRGFWVAGVLPDVTDPSPQGSATFSGTAIGAVVDQGQQRLASGAFTNVYNFNQRAGQVTISNFDGRTFGGAVAAGSDWRNYSGSLSGANLTGSVNGSFYGNRDAGGQLQVPKETAGNFNVRGSGYTASGVFLGTR